VVCTRTALRADRRASWPGLSGVALGAVSRRSVCPPYTASSANARRPISLVLEIRVDRERGADRDEDDEDDDRVVQKGIRPTDRAYHDGRNKQNADNPNYAQNVSPPSDAHRPSYAFLCEMQHTLTLRPTRGGPQGAR
jgi:hypothetical protein